MQQTSAEAQEARVQQARAYETSFLSPFHVFKLAKNREAHGCIPWINSEWGDHICRIKQIEKFERRISYIRYLRIFESK